MKIRALGPQAAAALAGLHARCFEDPWSAAAFKALLAQETVIALGAQARGALIAFALAQSAGETADLLTLGVDPARRRGGLGAKLLRALETQVATTGAKRFVLEVAETNAAAIALYERAGWRQAAVRPRYYADGANAALMTKTLSGRS